jgi:hypothetical protein
MSRAAPQSLPVPLAPEAYNKTNEQQARDTLDVRVRNLEQSTKTPLARSYTVATVPDAVESLAGAIIYVSNEAGGAVIAFSDGTNWRRVTDRAVIS